MLMLMIAFLLETAADQPDARGGPSTCVQCHLKLEAELSDPVLQAVGDIHFQKGLSCHDCHGGDPTVGIDTGGPEDSMSRAKGYIGRPARKQIATLCASCHSKLDYMRRYNPQARVDQYTEYLTSVHGKKYVAGDPSVATCIDCHGAHGVRAVKDPNGQVYATNVAATCARCHADAGRMAPYQIRTDQMELYSKSVHGEALLKNRDISSPTCNDCHGNHGAAPPGIDAVANVCGQCHAMQWELFNKSAHRKAFSEMGLPACVTCHEHHDVMRTSDAMLGVEASAKCVSCHDPGSAGYTAAGEMKSAVVRLQEHLHKAREVLERSERAWMEVSRPVYDLVEGRDRLVRARVEVHRFAAADVRKVTEEGERIAAASEQAGWKALADLAYRRKGLAVSVAILLFMIGLLLFKIREIETTDERR